MAKILLNSSLVPEITVDDSYPDGPAVVSTPVPEGMKWPQWVNSAWQEYKMEDDPCVQANPPHQK